MCGIKGGLWEELILTYFSKKLCAGRRKRIDIKIWQVISSRIKFARGMRSS